ncbi:MAG: EFR1 family ferrodoxin [Candidatus Erginobacter occultus]|nr:EFR1 family ferrodoxin [Candidatus Erginobacter occultus]
MNLKPDSIDLAYFSGTGNTGYLARLLAEKLSRRDIPVRLTRIAEASADPLPPAGGVLGLAYPIHALNAPSPVFDFISALPPGEGRRAFIVKGPADPFFAGGSSHLVIRALKDRGWEVFHESMVVMPSNVFVRYPDSFIRRLLRAAESRTETAAAEIAAGVPRLERPGPVARFLTRHLSRLETRGGKYFGRDLKASSACDLCGVCVRSCPVGNIRQEGREIVFGDRCIICMRCIYLCPRGAIRPRLFRFFPLKRWYDLGALSAAGPGQNAFGGKAGSGLQRFFRRYLESTQV